MVRIYWQLHQGMTLLETTLWYEFTGNRAMV
jgi:hypothetical protein